MHKSILLFCILVSTFSLNAYASVDAVSICEDLGIEMTYFSGPTHCIEMGGIQVVDCPIITRYSMNCERRF